MLMSRCFRLLARSHRKYPANVTQTHLSKQNRFPSGRNDFVLTDAFYLAIMITA